MKATIILSLLMIPAVFASAQTKPPIPDVLNQPSYFDKAGNVLVKLEKGVAKYATKTKPFGGYTLNYELEGEASPVHLKIPANASFIVALGDGMGDPTGWFSLFKTDVKKGKRIGNYMAGKQGMFSGKQEAGTGIITYEVRKLGNNLFEIIPSVRLEKAEYLFVNKGTLANYAGQGADAFAFGVD